MVEAHSPQGEGSGQETHMCEQNSNRVLEAGQFLEDWRRLNQLPVSLGLLDLEKYQKGLFGDKKVGLQIITEQKCLTRPVKM